MADYDNRAVRGQTGAVAGIDAGLRSYMLRIYNYMFAGLALTGIAAYGAYLATVTTDPATAAARLPKLGPLAGISSLLAVLFAVLAFQ